MAKPTLLQIQRQQNVDTVEELYREMEGIEGEVAIQPPSKLEDARICGRGDLIQFLLTWADRFPASSVYTHVQPNQPIEESVKQLESLFNTEHGFVISRLSQQNALIPTRKFCRTDGSDIEEPVLLQAFDSPQILTRPRPLEKGYRAFICVDNALEKRPDFLPGFSDVYRSRSMGFAAREEFSDLLWRLVDRATRAIKNKELKASLSGEKLKSVFSNCSRLFYELFENADRWGRREFGENSIRGAIVNFHFREHLTQTSLSKQVGENSPLFPYLSDSRSIFGAESQEFLEVSVFDNGPTLARHYLGKKPKSLKEEWRTTFSCLVKTVGRSQYENEGQGLFHVMRLLNSCRGFLRFRAGRLSLYRDFLHDPIEFPDELAEKDFYSEEEIDLLAEKMALRDWRARSHNFRIHPKAVGSLFTLLIPLNELLDES